MNYSFTRTDIIDQQKRRFLIFGSENYLEHKTLFDDVSCQKCFELTYKMKQCKNCSKIYCSNCFDSSKPKMYCQNCHCNEEALLPNQRLMTLNQILFKCRYYTNGCATKLNMESLFCHEEQCGFKQIKNIDSLIKNTESTVLNSNSDCSKELQANLYDSVRHPQTGEELVPFSLFKDLLREFAILRQICAANFKSKCNNGHNLIYESRDAHITSKVLCDVCKQLPTQQQIGSYRCDACDFDRCEQCYFQSKLF